MTADDIREFLARNVKRARLANELTTTQLADLIGGPVTPRHIWRWETGLHTPNLEHINAIARVTGHDVAWFYENHGRDDNGTAT